MSASWDGHYGSAKSELFFPDENLVRLLKKWMAPGGTADPVAADIGCGSGRHLKLFHDLGIAQTIGTDISHRGLVTCRKNFSSPLVQNDSRALALKSSSLDIAVAWGSLHYAPKDELPVMLEEIRRALKKNGRLFATLRSSRDTFLKKGRHLGNDTWITDLSDIKGSIVSFYAEDEVRKAFSIFSSFSIGLIERTIMGNLDQVLSHWVIDAEK